jgi:pentatricopeptide repeat protein
VEVSKAQLVFEKIDGRDLISWNLMISGYVGENALKTFDEMIKSELKPDSVTFVSVLSACSHAGLVSEGRWLFSQMINKFRIEPHMESYACMVFKRSK